MQSSNRPSLLLRTLARAKLAGVRVVHNQDVSPWRSRGAELKQNPVKRALRAGKPSIGTWLSLGSIAAARFMARAGFPWLTVDMEHTHTDIQTAAFMFGAIADAGCVPLRGSRRENTNISRWFWIAAPWASSPPW